MSLIHHPQILPVGHNEPHCLFSATKNPLFAGGGFRVLQASCWSTNKESDDDLLSQAQCLLSLARERFTVLFGMGRGGSTQLWSSDKGVKIKANLIWLYLDPAFELSGVLCDLAITEPTALFHAGCIN